MKDPYFCQHYRKFGDFQYTTFSDSCYVEIYSEFPSNLSIVEAGVEMMRTLNNYSVAARAFVASGHTLRRNASLVDTRRRRERSIIFHAVGVGSAILKAFEGEESHFEGKVFVEASLYDNGVSGRFPNLGDFRSVRGSAEFVRLV